MRDTGPMRNDPGRWCEQHQRWECTKRGKRGGTCHGSRIAGTDACRMHAGVRRDVAKAKGEAVTAWSALAGQAAVSATDAVLGMLHMSWLRVHLYAGLLRRQVDDAQADQPFSQIREKGTGGPSGVGVGAGLVGQTLSGVKDIGIFATGEAIRGLAQLEAAERDRCVRFAKAAHDMGIAEQQIRLAEEQGALIVTAFTRVLEAMAVSPEQRTAGMQAMARELRAIEGGV